jgi:hypothetical protein
MILPPTCSLQTAKKADPSYLERFAIFSREQQHTQKSAGSSGQATDLVSYVEFQRNYRLVMKVHKEALLSMRIFWMCLLQHQIKFDAMSAAVERMDTAIKAAERTYRWGHAYTCMQQPALASLGNHDPMLMNYLVPAVLD